MKKSVLRSIKHRFNTITDFLIKVSLFLFFCVCHALQKIISEETFHERHQTYKQSDLPGKEMKMRLGQV